MSNTEKKVKPLKKVKALKQQKEIDELMLKPAVRIQKLKNSLIILGYELFATKKINDSLYRKIQLLTYSRTTEQKLKDSYKTLKDIDNSIKQSEVSQGEDKPKKPKKKTLKDFKENKKTVDDDRNTLYNIDLKFKSWYIFDKNNDKKVEKKWQARNTNYLFLI